MNIFKRILAIISIAALCVSGTALAEEASPITARDYLGEWVDLNGIRNIDIQERKDGEGYTVHVRMEVSDGIKYGYIAWTYGCIFNEESRALKSLSRITSAGDYDPAGEEEITDTNSNFTDAAFFFDEEGRLIWSDEAEGLDDGMVFQRTPGWNFVGEWQDERVTIGIFETRAGYEVTAAASGNAFARTVWLYTCDYDTETDSLISNGEIAERYDYAYDENQAYSQTLVYSDGKAVFSLDQDGFLIWRDQKENAGEGLRFEKGF